MGKAVSFWNPRQRGGSSIQKRRPLPRKEPPRFCCASGLVGAEPLFKDLLFDALFPNGLDAGVQLLGQFLIVLAEREAVEFRLAGHEADVNLSRYSSLVLA